MATTRRTPTPRKPRSRAARNVAKLDVDEAALAATEATAEVVEVEVEVTDEPTVEVDQLGIVTPDAEEEAPFDPVEFTAQAEADEFNQDPDALAEAIVTEAITPTEEPDIDAEFAALVGTITTEPEGPDMTTPTIEGPTTLPNEGGGLTVVTGTGTNVTGVDGLDVCERIEAIKDHTTLDGNEEGTEFSFAGVGPAWHDFGKQVNKPMTIDQALELSNTGAFIYDVDLTANFATEDENGEPIVIPVDAPQRTARVIKDPYTGLYRTVAILNRALPTVQNREVVEVAYDALGALEGQGKVVSIGSFKQFRKFFISLELQGLKVGGEDAVNLFLTFLEHHDGEGTLTAVTSAVRAECRNTTNLAIGKAKTRMSLNHRGDIKGRMAGIAKALEITGQYREAYAAEAEAQWNQDFTDLQFYDLIENAFGKRPDPEEASKAQVTGWDNRYELVLAQRTAPTNSKSQPGSAWNAMQALVTYDNYFARTTGKTDEDKQRLRSTNLILGDGEQLKVEAKALAFIQAARGKKPEGEVE